MKELTTVLIRMRFRDAVFQLRNTGNTDILASNLGARQVGGKGSGHEHALHPINVAGTDSVHFAVTIITIHLRLQEQACNVVAHNSRALTYFILLGHFRLENCTSSLREVV